MASNLPPGCTTLPGEDAESQRQEAIGDDLYGLIEKHLQTNDMPHLDNKVDDLVEDLLELIVKLEGRAVSDALAEAKMWEGVYPSAGEGREDG